MTASSPPDRARDNHLNTELLAAELPAARYVDERLPPVALRREPVRTGDPARRSTTTACASRTTRSIPQRYRGRDGVVPAAFSLHTVVRSGHPAQGLLPDSSGAEIYAEASAAGWQFSTGVCNDKSIGAVVEVHGLEDAGAAPGEAVPAAAHRSRGRQPPRRRRAFLESDRFADLTAGLDDFPVQQWTNSYTTEYLAGVSPAPAPGTSLHSNDEFVAVTTHDARFGVRAAVILKLFRRAEAPSRRRADAIVGAACRFHRAPYAVYAGFNSRVRVRGVRPPRRLQPSPLHLILRSLSPDDRPGHASPSTPSSSSTWTRTDGGRAMTDARSPSPSTSRTTGRRPTPPSATPRSPVRCSTSSTPAACAARSSWSARPPRRTPSWCTESRPAATRSACTVGGTNRSPNSTPSRSGPTSSRGKALLEDLTGTPVLGFRAPTFSLVPDSRWAVDVLADAGFTYSSSVLPARSPLFGDPSLPTTPFRWPNGLVELPVPGGARRRARAPLPRRRLPPRDPGRGSSLARRSVGRDQLLWIYCHPYDFDPDEEFWVVPDAGRLGSRLLWYNRRRTFAKIETMLRGRAGPPLAERLTEVPT